MWWIFLPKLIQLLSECLHLSASKKRHRLQSDFAKLKFSNCSDCSNKCSLQFTNSLRIRKLSKRIHNLKKFQILKSMSYSKQTDTAAFADPCSN